jgi:hypothetical protein
LDGVKKNKPFRIAVIVAILVFVALAINYVYYLSELKNVQKIIRDKGYPVTLRELAKWHKFPLKDENSAENLRRAFKYFDRPALPENRIIFAGTAKLPGLGQPLEKNTVKVSENYLLANATAVELIEKHLGSGKISFFVDLEKGYSIEKNAFKHLLNILKASSLLSIKAVLAAEKGDTANSIKCIKNIFRLSETINNEPISASFIIFSDVQEDATVALEWLLNTSKLSDKQLAELDRLLAEAEHSGRPKRALIGDMCYYTDNYRPIIKPQFLAKLFFRLLGAELRSNIILYREITRLAEAADSPEMFFAKQRETEKRIKALPGFMGIPREALASITEIIILNVERITIIRLARISVAIERYRLKYGKLPVELEDLSPGFLEKVPKDPFSGENIKFLNFGNKYRIYSIGEDGRDNEGKMTEKFISLKREKGDIAFSVNR